MWYDTIRYDDIDSEQYTCVSILCLHSERRWHGHASVCVCLCVCSHWNMLHRAAAKDEEEEEVYLCGSRQYMNSHTKSTANISTRAFHSLLLFVSVCARRIVWLFCDSRYRYYICFPNLKITWWFHNSQLICFGEFTTRQTHNNNNESKCYCCVLHRAL